MNRVNIETDFTDSGTKIIDAETGEQLKGTHVIEISQLGNLRSYSITVKVWFGKMDKLNG